jgi:hypothetical protein
MRALRFPAVDCGQVKHRTIPVQFKMHAFSAVCSVNQTISEGKRRRVQANAFDGAGMALRCGTLFGPVVKTTIPLVTSRC